MAKKFDRNDKLLVHQHTPNLGAHVWLWDSDGATSEKVLKVQGRAKGKLFYWLGRYKITPAGISYAQVNGIYYNPASDPKLKSWADWGIPKKHLSKVWVEGDELSYPYKRHDSDRFEHRFTKDELIKYIRKLERERTKTKTLNIPINW